jgi:hypothetical protein
VTKFDRYTIKEFEEGFEFTELAGYEMCKKYIPPVKGTSMSSGTKKGKKPKASRMIDGQFHFHVDTENLLRNIHRVSPSSVISISRKVHGTSAIVSNCLVMRRKTLLERLTFWDKSVKTAYGMIYASRSVIKNDALDAGGFYGFDIWRDAGEKFFKGKLAQGETAYFEIVGHTPSGACIQKGYDYGCPDKEYKIAVYRLTLTSPDGHVVEYGWQAKKERCAELGVSPVEEFYFGQAGDLFEIDRAAEDWRQQFIAALRGAFLERWCPYSKNKVADEGSYCASRA